MRIGILTSHPIQYQAPWFRALAKEADLHVFFAHRQTAIEQGRAGFGVAFDWDVDLLSGYTHVFLRNKARKPGVNHFFGCDTPEIAEAIPKKRFDAFIVTGWYLKSYWQAVCACQRAHMPIFVRGDSQLQTPRSRIFEPAKEVIYRIMLRWFDGFLTVGKRNREYLAHYGVSEKKMFSAPHFVDNEWFAARAFESANVRDKIRGQWGANATDVAALFVGKFIPKKRPTDLLEALAKSQKNDVSVVGVLVGAGELEAKLRGIASRERLRVHFAGFRNQTELPAIYAAADVLVLPSDGCETWGLVVNEAMACGLPAIVSDAVGCAPDLIEEGKTGFVFPLGDIAALAGSLVKFAELKRAGHDFVPALADKLRAYSLETAVRGTLRAVEALSIPSNG